MIRKNRNRTFWILAFSINLVPLVAQGDGPAKPGSPLVKACAEAVAAPAPKAEWQWEDKRSPEEAAKQKKLAEQKAKAAKIAKQKKLAKLAAAKKAAEEKKVATAESGATPTVAKKEYRYLTARLEEPHGKGSVVITKLNEPQGKDPVVIVKEEPAVITESAKGHDLSIAELQGAFLSFEAKNGKLLGRVFNNCKAEFEFTTSTNGCGGNASFKVLDKRGEGVACMKRHKDANDICTDSSCSFLSALPGGSIELSSLGDVNIQLLRRNPNGNEDKQVICEDFSPAMTHVTEATKAAERAQKKATAKAALIALYEQQAKGCTRSTEELAIARFANSTLLIAGRITAEQARKNDIRYADAELAALKKRAARDPLSDLGSVRSDLSDWIDAYPGKCSSAVDVYREIARRYATKKIPRGNRRDGDSADPMEGYNEALATMDEGLEHSCLEDSEKMADIRTNIDMNRVENFGKVNGFYDPGFRSEYVTLLTDLEEQRMDNCGFFNDTSDPACVKSWKSLYTANTIQMYGQDAEVKRYNSQMALRQMTMQPGANPMMGGSGNMSGSIGGYYGTSGGGSSYGMGRL